MKIIKTNIISLIIKAAMIAFLAVYLFLLYRSDYAKDVSMDEISAALSGTESIASLDEQGRNELRRFYQIDSADTDGFFFYKASSPMAVDEAFVVRAKDQDQASTFLSDAESHLSSQKTTFEGYGAEQMALLNNAIVESRGNYVYYFCGADADDWYAALLKVIGA